MASKGILPKDWVGQEIRVWDDSGTFRVVYTARLLEVVYVLHAFQKKTQATSKKDIDLAKTRYAEGGVTFLL